MCKLIGKSNERILCKLSKSEILRWYSIVHVVVETTKTSHLTCQSKSFISTFFTCQVSACKLQPFSCHNLANDIYSQTAKLCSATLNKVYVFTFEWKHDSQYIFPFTSLNTWTTDDRMFLNTSEVSQIVIFIL